MTYNSKDLKEMSNAVRALALDMLRLAHSGHIGIVLGAADVITTVYANFLRRGRDRFVLSAGHGSALLYSVLKLAGYEIGDVEFFRKMGGLPGHPEYTIPGVEATTGPLGQGVGNAVGMAMAEKINKTNSCVYCMCSDGDLMEGVAQEAIVFAGRYKLNNLILLWLDNGISIDGIAQTDIDMPSRMLAAGWKIESVAGDDFVRLNKILTNAQKSNAPVFVQCKTEIGSGSSLAGSPKAHAFALHDIELMQLIQKYSSSRGVELWNQIAHSTASTISGIVQHELPDVAMPIVSNLISTRELSGIYLNELLQSGAQIIGGSADLGGSTNAKVSASWDIQSNDFSGNYINYGVREHAMGAIMNGMSACGLRVYGSTFLVFSDYMRPSMRLAAMSGLPVVYVLTHDSVAVGEDGPTHQPIEQLPSLRLIPNMNVFRPCNVAEVVWSWRRALSSQSAPTCIILSRQSIRLIEPPQDADISRGAYIIRRVRGRVRATIIATGSEVPLAISVAEKLGNNVQVVSMPSVSDFRAQDAAYQKKILRGFVVAIEAAASAPWFEFADAVVGIDNFGLSGPGGDVYTAMGFDADIIAHDLAEKIK